MIATKAFEDILPHCVVLQRGQASALALTAVLNRVTEGKTELRKTGGLSPQFCEGEIEMRDVSSPPWLKAYRLTDKVSFTYPSRLDQRVLHDCSFFFPAGKMTFIVGKSGSGKSTLGNLLMRLYRGQTGTILVDGNQIQDIDTTWLRNNITLVQQECILFGGTILSNIALEHQGHGRVIPTQVDRCLKLAGLQKTIAQLPDGVQTRVGAGGAFLSGGQRQRIAIARACLRDTPILILDEATSALDSLSRSSVMEAIRKWRRGRTTITITHDMAQIQDEDFVYVLENGRIVHEGRRRNVAGMNKGAMWFAASGSGLRPHVNQNTGLDTLDEISVCSQASTKRKDSFDAEIEASTEKKPSHGSQYDLEPGHAGRRMRKGFSASTEAALNSLKRQSLSRARAMYSLGPSRPPLDEMPTGLTVLDISRHDSPSKAIFTPASPRKRMSHDKPLPVPPSMIELLDNTPSFGTRERRRMTTMRGQTNGPYSSLAILATVWRLLDNVNRIKLIFGCLATLGHAGSPPAFSYALVQIFSTFSLTAGYQKKALTYSMVLIGVAFADGMARFLMLYLLDCVSQVWVDSLRNEAVTRMLQQAKYWFDEEENRPSILVPLLDRNAEEMKSLVGQFGAQMLAVIVMLVVAIFWSIALCWKITLVSLAAMPVLYALTRGFGMVSSHWESRMSAAIEQIGDIFVETFSDIKTVRSLTLESYFHQRYFHATQAAFSTGTRRALYGGLFFGLSDSAIVFFTPMIFWYGAHLVHDGQWPVKSILTVFSLLLFCTANANNIVTSIPRISSAAETATQLLQVAQMTVDSHEDGGRVKLDKEALSGPIHFVNQTFFYPTRPKVAALQRLNLAIPWGKVVAIVGASGSGKSTIVSLLLGLYPPAGDGLAPSFSRGSTGPPSLTLFGRDIRTLDLAILRSLIAVVPQSPVLLPTTVRENISYGLSPGSPLASVPCIESAARSAGIHEFILALPQGYATVIGEGGLAISGGQAQRIVIARALVRDPKILILDEATSALDWENAEIVKQSVLRVMDKTRGTLTIIVVTHSKAMMRFADHVVVLDKGSVAEQGTFQELLSRREKLWEMLSENGQPGGTRDGLYERLPVAEE